MEVTAILTILVGVNAGIAFYYWFKSEVQRGIIEHLGELLDVDEIEIGEVNIG